MPNEFGEGPVFPIDRLHIGITIRDYLAALAMQGYCGDPLWRSKTSQEITAQAAYAMADAMLATRGGG